MTDPFRGSRVAQVALAVVCAKVAVAILLFDLRAFAQYSPTKALAEHSLSFVLVGLLVALVLQHGRAAFPWSPLHVPAAALGIAYALATVFALDRGVALNGAEGRALGLATMLDSLVLYAGVVVLVRTRSHLRWVGLTIAGAIVAEVAYVGLQILNVVPGTQGASNRPVGTTGSADPLGQLLSALAAGALGIAIATGVTRNARLLALALAVLAGAGWLASGTRAPIVGLVLAATGLAAVWILEAPSGQARVRRLAPLLAAMALALAGVALSPMGGRLAIIARSVPALLTGDVGALDKNIAGRMDHYRISLEAAFAHPLLGVGPDNYTVAYPTFRLPGTRDMHGGYEAQTSNHSGLFKVLVDAGFTGLVAFLAFLSVGFRLALRDRGRPWVFAATAMLASYVGTSLVSINHVATEWIPYFALGLIAAPIAEKITDREPDKAAVPRRAEGRRSRREARGRPADALRVGGAIAIAAGIFLAITPYRAWQASHDAFQARAALARSGDDAARAAVALAQRSVEADPGRPPYWTQLGSALLRLDRTRDAMLAFARAADLQPYETTNLVDLVTVQVALGRQGDDEARQQAIATARRAVDIDPYRPANSFALGLALYENKAYDEAAQAMERGLALDLREVPSYGYEVAASAYLRLDKPTDAERWCRMGLDDQASRDREVALRLLLAQALLDLGRPAEALAEVNKVLALDAGNATAKQLKQTIERGR